MNLKFLAAVKKIDAAVLFEYMHEQLGRRAGTIAGTSFERLANDLNVFGLRTSRDALFTARVIRANLARLEEMNVVSRSANEDGTFDLYVFQPYPDAAEIVVESADENGNENRNGNGNDEKSEKRQSVININKQTNEQKISCFDSKSEPKDPDSVDDAVARVDFSDRRVRTFRDRLVRDVWEPGLRSALVDRAVAAVALHLATTKELKAAIRESREQITLRKTTNGFRGKGKFWETFCLRVKDWFDAADYVWTPTAAAREPEPQNEIALDETDAIIAASDARRASSAALRPVHLSK